MARTATFIEDAIENDGWNPVCFAHVATYIRRARQGLGERSPRGDQDPPGLVPGICPPALPVESLM